MTPHIKVSIKIHCNYFRVHNLRFKECHLRAAIGYLKITTLNKMMSAMKEICNFQKKSIELNQISFY